MSTGGSAVCGRVVCRWERVKTVLPRPRPPRPRDTVIADVNQLRDG